MKIRPALALTAVLFVPLAACSSGAAASSAPATTAATETTAASQSPSATASSSATSSATATYTMAEVATHNSESDCWAAIDGKVYNLTSWISRHPGGSDKIIPLCGTDGSSAFNGKHGNDERPHEMLKEFLVGTLTD